MTKEKKLNIFSTLEPSVRRNLLTLFAAGLLFWSSLASLLPTIPLYVNHVGGTAQQVGIVMGAFAIGLLLFRPALGRMADNRSRKIVLLLGTAVAAIAPVGFLFVKSIPLLIALRAFHGISIAAFTTAYNALVVDLSPVHQRGESIGYMSLVQPIGVAIGPAVGGLIQDAAGFAALFLVSAVMGTLSLFAATQVRETSREREEGEREGERGKGKREKGKGKREKGKGEREGEAWTVKSPVGQASRLSYPVPNHQSRRTGVPPVVPSPQSPENDRFWELLLSPRLRIPSLVFLLIGLVFGALVAFVPLYITEAKVNLNAGWLYTAAAVASFSSRLFIGRASDRYGRGLFISGSLVCYAISMVILSESRSAIAFLLAGFLEGAGSGTLFPMMIALISDRSSPLERGRVFALCVCGFDLGTAISGPVLGSFTSQLGYRGIFTLSAGLAFLALVIFVTQSSKNLRHSLKFAIGRERDVYAFNKF